MLLPGFISGHTHVSAGTPTRGLVESGRNDLRPLELVEALLDDDELDALTEYNLAELLLSGCTTQLEMSCTLRQAESYVRVASRFGARGYPGAMLPNLTRLGPIITATDDSALYDAEAGTLEEIEQNLAFARKYSGEADGRILPMMSPMAADFHTPETMKAIAKAASELGTGIHTHLAWHPMENPTMQRRWGQTSAQWFDDFGLLDGPFFGAHMGYPDWSTDAPLLSQKGAIYSHCPGMSGLGGPTQPYPEALGHGIRTNVGIDTHSNNYLEVLKLAVITGQARYHLLKDISELPIAEPTMLDAIKGATLYPAEALGRGDLGRIEEGALADLVAIDVSGFLVGGGALPPEPLNNLLYASGQQVRHVMTQGHLQVRDGLLQVADATAVMKRGGKVIQKIWTALQAEGWLPSQE
ncbi:amidohydrolase family protein [Altererythrobacter sp. GH1-8]|uniref:amidohydrolase family protein n=1 Tax=Altererythrobacter sp. GH1-8 TaxID=3349333 RepID=UPI00374D2BEC